MSSDTLPDFSCLDNESAIDDFFERTQGLHDSCITGFYVSNPMYVDREGNMIFPEGNFPGATNLTVFLQSQFLTGATVELRLIDVEHLKFQGVGKNNDGIVLDAKLILDEAKRVQIICNPDVADFFEVKARAAFWRIRSDFIDSLAFTVLVER